jgi:predicted kinase
MLIVFAGLPGTGKTTVSRAVAGELDAVYLRVDTIEQAIIGVCPTIDIGPAGYIVANAIAEANLKLGRRVVVDCVNPVFESRLAWREVAGRTSARLIEIEIICSDRLEHRRRVETREADIPGHTLPSWEAVVAHRYEEWDRPRVIVDTASGGPAYAVAAVLAEVSSLPHQL